MGNLEEEVEVGEEETAVDGTDVGACGVDDIGGGDPSPEDVKGVRITDDMVLQGREHCVSYLECEMIVFERKAEESVKEDQGDASGHQGTL